ncbi:hypothetical protein [Nocardia farcinica]|uniref:hypothetical protein n=1 Tax=Nocardia farcinica TaxID=37329 RepID=UPI001E2AA0EF|nr:hypothetical protein [Nocardia farcinica]
MRRTVHARPDHRAGAGALADDRDVCLTGSFLVIKHAGRHIAEGDRPQRRRPPDPDILARVAAMTDGG